MCSLCNNFFVLQISCINCNKLTIIGGGVFIRYCDFIERIVYQKYLTEASIRYETFIFV